MREILFRGKDIAGNWHYGVPLVFTEDYVCMTAPHAYNKAVIPESVSEFTGLTDKNGKKIFEGDIVKNEFGEIDKVAFLFGRFVPFNRYPECSCFFSEHCEVIGNIHDNPELLEGKK